jgi:hypothetical protein
MKNLTFVLLLLLTVNVFNVSINKSEATLKKDDVEVEEHFHRIEENLEGLENCHHGKAKELNKSLQENEQKLEELHRKSEQALYDEHRQEESAQDGCIDMLEMHLAKEEDFRETHLHMEQERREEDEEQIEQLVNEQHEDEVSKLNASLNKLESEYVVEPGLEEDFQETRNDLYSHIVDDDNYIECYYDNLDNEKTWEVLDLVTDVNANEDELIHNELTSDNTAIETPTVEDSNIVIDTSTNVEQNASVDSGMIVDTSDNFDSDTSDLSVSDAYNMLDESTADSFLPPEGGDDDEDMMFMSSYTPSDDEPMQIQNDLINQLTKDEECLKNELNQEEQILRDFYRRGESEERDTHKQYEDRTDAEYAIVDDNNRQERRHSDNHNLLEAREGDSDRKILDFVNHEHSNLITRLQDIIKSDSHGRGVLINDTEDNLSNDEQVLHDALVKMELDIESIHEAEENDDIKDHEAFEDCAHVGVIREHETEEERLEDLHYSEEEEIVAEHQSIMDFLEDEHDDEFEVLESMRSS